MNLIAIDPGPTESAWLVFDPDGSRVLDCAIERNEMLNMRLRGKMTAGNAIALDHMAIEMIASYGMGVGADVFETCVWIGRFLEQWAPYGFRHRPYSRIYRREVKAALCHSPRANDSAVRAALIDRYGGKAKAIGKKTDPGPLYGVRKDLWAALGVAVTWAIREGKLPELPHGDA